MTWRATVLTLFPEMFPGPLGVSLAGKALASGLWALEARDIRDSATDRHRSVDDTPAGGGPAWCCAPTCWRLPSTPPTSPRIGRAC
jgi:tRNA (guanine37-N1)-methyltransferase